MWSRLFEGPVSWQVATGALLATVVLGWLSARLAQRVVRAGMGAILQDTLPPSSRLVRGPLRLVGAAAFLLVVATLLFPAFEAAGLKPRTGVHLHTVAAWTFGSGLRVLLILLIAYAAVRTAGLLVRRFENEVSSGTGLDAIERAKRARTLGAVVSKVTTALITGIAVLMVLREFDLEIAPVLTGAGIVGLAVGFGAQTLVRDIISGFFMILENQVRVGDVAAINGTGGLVEAINLRTIVLRDEHGTVHIFPNGAINTLANFSKDFSYAVVEVPVSYREEVDAVAAIFRSIGASLEADSKYSTFVLGPVEVMGVDAFHDWSMTIKFRMKTVPLKQWDVARELRRRVRVEFDARGIEVPFPGRIPPPRDRQQPTQ
jgi:small conductance mechanosensitive channel